MREYGGTVLKDGFETTTKELFIWFFHPKCYGFTDIDNRMFEYVDMHKKRVLYINTLIMPMLALSRENSR